MTKARILLFFVVAFAALAIAGAIFAGRRGFSAREKPSSVEAYLATSVRTLAVPSRAKSEKNPFEPSPELLAEARAHFADHCAICHANDGGGHTEIGQNLYPKAPDMRLPQTQRQTDGELYYTIHNGIRLTGMPAWGPEQKDDDSWKLVLFIRHLPRLAPAEEREMESLNPKGPAEQEEERQEEEFLNSEPSRQPPKESMHSHTTKEKP
jgi:mono/diheme cytochrome c family protein